MLRKVVLLPTSEQQKKGIWQAKMQPKHIAIFITKLMCQNIDCINIPSVCQVLAVHQNRWLSVNEGVKSYALLSNDNGFLSYNPFFFTERTLTAR